MLFEYVGGSVAGKVIPGPVVCLLRNGGFVVDVGEVTVDVVNLDDVVVPVLVAVVVAMVVVVVAVEAVVVVVVVVIVAVVDGVVASVAVDEAVVDVVDDAVDAVVMEVTVEVAVWVFGSGTLGKVGFDFWSILSELDFSEEDGLEAFEETLSFLSSDSSVFVASSLLLCTASSPLDASAFFAETKSAGIREGPLATVDAQLETKRPLFFAAFYSVTLTLFKVLGYAKYLDFAIWPRSCARFYVTTKKNTNNAIITCLIQLEGKCEYSMCCFFF